MSSAVARAFWVAQAERGEIRAESLPAATGDSVVVRALYSGVSRGTESIVFRGAVPVSEYERMRAPFQAGAFPFPVKYGYASVGRVEEGPAHLLNRTVFVLHPHQTRYVVPVSAAHPIPDDVPPGRAVLAANVETAINGLWDARPALGDRVIVIGAGTVGCVTAWLAARIPGCEVVLVDINPGRAEVARALGVRFATPATVAEGADLVLHTSGAPAGLDLALRVAAPEATIVEMSWYGDQLVPLALGGPFHARRLTLRSSQVGTVSPAQRPRWDERRRMGLALRMLSDPTLDTLVTGESAFDDLPQTMTRLAGDAGRTLCHRIRYE